MIDEGEIRELIRKHLSVDEQGNIAKVMSGGGQINKYQENVI